MYLQVLASKRTSTRLVENSIAGPLIAAVDWNALSLMTVAEITISLTTVKKVNKNLSIYKCKPLSVIHWEKVLAFM